MVETEIVPCLVDSHGSLLAVSEWRDWSVSRIAGPADPHHIGDMLVDIDTIILVGM
jgi:hypothetical protein